VQVAVPEVPPVDHIGDQLSLAHVVVLDVVDRTVDEAVRLLRDHDHLRIQIGRRQGLETLIAVAGHRVE